MPTHKPRIQIAISGEAYAVLEEASAAVGATKSAMVAQLVEQALPLWRAMGEAVRRAQYVQEAEALDQFAHWTEDVDTTQYELPIESTAPKKPKLRRRHGSLKTPKGS
jgi:hypothetical protein